MESKVLGFCFGIITYTYFHTWQVLNISCHIIVMYIGMSLMHCPVWRGWEYRYIREVAENMLPHSGFSPCMSVLGKLAKCVCQINFHLLWVLAFVHISWTGLCPTSDLLNWHSRLAKLAHQSKIHYFVTSSQWNPSGLLSFRWSAICFLCPHLMWGYRQLGAMYKAKQHCLPELDLNPGL